jgi:hypothetical protein
VAHKLANLGAELVAWEAWAMRVADQMDPAAQRAERIASSFS